MRLKTKMVWKYKYSLLVLYLLMLTFGAENKVAAQNTPTFNSKQLIDVTNISAWNFAQRGAGWYRIGAMINNGPDGLRGNAIFELRENADHSNLRFEIGVSFNSLTGSSVTVTSHSYWSAPTFLKIRLLSKDTYDPMFIEVYVAAHNNDNQPFNAFVFNPMAYGDWTLVNWMPGVVPAGYTVSEFDVNQLFSVGNMDKKNILSVSRNGNVGISNTNPTEKLSVNGNIKAKEVKVTIQPSEWPDYVFENNYALTPLPELEAFIQKNKHLPGMPKAAEAEANGIALGDMNRKLLEKLEELTLHLIEKDKIISHLLKRVESIEKKIN